MMYLLVGGGLYKGTVVPALPSPERALPTPALAALALKLVNLVPPHASLVLLKLLLLCWSPEQMSLYASESSSGPPKWIPSSPATLHFSWTQSLLVSQPYVMGTPFTGTGAMG